MVQFTPASERRSKLSELDGQRWLGMWRRVPRQVRKKIETFDESGMGYWIVRATLRDGRVFSNVIINDLFQLGFPDLSPFKARHISDVEWEGYRGGKSSGAPILIADGDPS